MSDANNLGLGQIILGAAERNAIHVPIAPIVAAEKLYPGQSVDISEGKAVASTGAVGIVDPFLKSPVFVGQRFWLFMLPGSVTDLRHEWSHPAFPEVVTVVPAEPVEVAPDDDYDDCRGCY